MVLVFGLVIPSYSFANPQIEFDKRLAKLEAAVHRSEERTAEVLKKIVDRLADFEAGMAAVTGGRGPIVCWDLIPPDDVRPKPGSDGITDRSYKEIAVYVAQNEITTLEFPDAVLGGVIRSSNKFQTEKHDKYLSLRLLSGDMPVEGFPLVVYVKDGSMYRFRVFEFLEDHPKDVHITVRQRASQ